MLTHDNNEKSNLLETFREFLEAHFMFRVSILVFPCVCSRLRHCKHLNNVNYLRLTRDSRLSAHKNKPRKIQTLTQNLLTQLNSMQKRVFSPNTSDFLHISCYKSTRSTTRSTRSTRLTCTSWLRCRWCY